MVGAGGRQRGYHKAGRVKKAGRVGRKVQVTTGKYSRGKRSEMSDGAKQDFAVFAWKCAA